ncbi:urate hydroxylase PuuD [Bradyrhizobium sp.]|uniref:urate hydroxylase PuuD n=1 Tax=Bradyrhizobium sp. TaxID=376 RepID=UPI0040379B89
MDTFDAFRLIDLALRWLHVGGALIWIGHNYANFISRPDFIPFAGEARPADAAGNDFQSRLQREHGTFRWASVVVWLTGLAMLSRNGMLVDAVTLSGAAAPIGVGFWIGTMMVMNLWLVLWPHQKKVLGFVPASHEERVQCSRVTFLSARVNTMLSIPLLFLMMAGGHGLLLG